MLSLLNSAYIFMESICMGWDIGIVLLCFRHKVMSREVINTYTIQKPNLRWTDKGLDVINNIIIITCLQTFYLKNICIKNPKKYQEKTCSKWLLLAWREMKVWNSIAGTNGCTSCCASADTPGTGFLCVRAERERQHGVSIYTLNRPPFMPMNII